MSLISLTYISVATRPMTSEDLKDILEVSRRNNAQKFITGMLLFRNGYFIQALEGEEAVVMALYDKIAKDERHRNVLTVHKETIDKRSFGSWSMGFHNLDDEDTDKLQAYTDFLDQPFDVDLIKNSGNRTLALLELFKEGPSY